MRFTPTGILNFSPLAGAGERTRSSWDSAFAHTAQAGRDVGAMLDKYREQSEALRQRQERARQAANWGTSPWARGEAFEAAKQQYIMDGNASGIAQLQRDWQAQENMRAVNQANAARESAQAKAAEEAARKANEDEVFGAVQAAGQEVSNYITTKSDPTYAGMSLEAMTTKAQNAIDTARRKGATDAQLADVVRRFDDAKGVIREEYAAGEAEKAAEEAKKEEAKRKYRANVASAREAFGKASRFQQDRWVRDGMNVNGQKVTVTRNVDGTFTFK